MAASGFEKVRGEVGCAEAGGVGSGPCGCTGDGESGKIDGGDSLEGTQVGAEFSQTNGEEKLYQRSGGCGTRRRRFMGGRRISESMHSLCLQGECLSPLGDRFHCLH